MERLKTRFRKLAGLPSEYSFRSALAQHFVLFCVQREQARSIDQSNVTFEGEKPSVPQRAPIGFCR